MPQCRSVTEPWGCRADLGLGLPPGAESFWGDGRGRSAGGGPQPSRTSPSPPRVPRPRLTALGPLCPPECLRCRRLSPAPHLRLHDLLSSSQVLNPQVLTPLLHLWSSSVLSLSHPSCPPVPPLPVTRPGALCPHSCHSRLCHTLLPTPLKTARGLQVRGQGPLSPGPADKLISPGHVTIFWGVLHILPLPLPGFAPLALSVGGASPQGPPVALS